MVQILSLGRFEPVALVCPDCGTAYMLEPDDLRKETLVKITGPKGLTRTVEVYCPLGDCDGVQVFSPADWADVRAAGGTPEGLAAEAEADDA